MIETLSQKIRTVTDECQRHGTNSELVGLYLRKCYITNALDYSKHDVLLEDTDVNTDCVDTGWKVERGSENTSELGNDSLYTNN